MRALPDDATEDDRHLAVLHDTIEDCRPRLAVLMRESGISEPQTTVAYLEYFRRVGYSDYVVTGLMLLTREMWSLSYSQYIHNIIASGHRGAMLVKYFDNAHNSDPDRLANLLPEHRPRAVALRSRYQRSLRLLTAALGFDNSFTSQ